MFGFFLWGFCLKWKTYRSCKNGKAKRRQNNTRKTEKKHTEAQIWNVNRVHAQIRRFPCVQTAALFFLCSFVQLSVCVSLCVCERGLTSKMAMVRAQSADILNMMYLKLNIHNRTKTNTWICARPQSSAYTSNKRRN